MSAEILLAGAPWLSAIGNMLLAGALLSRTVLAGKTQGCIGKTLLAEKPQGCIGKMLLAGGAVSAEMLLAGAPWLSAIGKQQPAVRAQSSIGKH